MNLAELLPASQCVVPLVAPTLADAALLLAGTLDQAGRLAHVDRLIERIEDARTEDIIGLADRAFVFHYRTDASRELAVAMGIAPKPLRRDLGDGGESQSARLVVLVVGPPKLAARTLQVVGSMARFLSKPERVAALLTAKDGAAIALDPALNAWDVRAELTVRDLMSAKPRTIAPDAPLRSAVLDMVRAGVGGLPVVDDENQVIGMFSERELLRYLLSHYLPRAEGAQSPPSPAAARRTVRDVMTRQVLCVAPEQPLAEVASLMLNKDVDRVPVVKNGVLVGFLTRGDIVRKLIGP